MAGLCGVTAVVMGRCGTLDLGEGGSSRDDIVRRIVLERPVAERE